MHPEFVATIATDRHKDLLITAERRRRARLARVARPAGRGNLGAAVTQSLLRGWQQLRGLAIPARRSAPDPCSC